MWELKGSGEARFRVSDWQLQVRCWPEAIDLIATRGSSRPSAGGLSFVGGRLPVLEESFIRGDELHLSLPQAEGQQAALVVVVLVIQADPECLVIESTLSIETMLLDAHPSIELAMAGEGPLMVDVLDSAKVFSRDCSADNASSQRPRLQVLVDQRDHCSLDPTCNPMQSLRFFGEFMEKGVIRKTQPWWVWSGSDANAASVRQLVLELARRPLPLAN